MKLLLSLFAFCAVASLSAQKTMTLRDCIERAQQRNIKVQQADLARRQQEIQLDDARKAMLPEVGGSAGENLSFGRGLTANNTYETRNTNSTSFSVSGSMPLYTGGRITHRRKQAALQLQAAGADAQRIAEELQLQVAQAYYQVLFRMDLIAQAQTNLRNTLAQEERMAATDPRRPLAGGRFGSSPGAHGTRSPGIGAGRKRQNDSPARTFATARVSFARQPRGGTARHPHFACRAGQSGRDLRIESHRAPGLASRTAAFASRRRAN